MSIRIGIMGYGNLGRGVECAVAQNADMELKAVFTRRNPEELHIWSKTAKVVSASELADWKNELDVLILCGGSATDLPVQTPHYASMYNVVDSFDTHAYLNDLRYGNETKESEQFQRRLDRYRERYLFPDSDTAPAAAKEEPNK